MPQIHRTGPLGKQHGWLAMAGASIAAVLHDAWSMVAVGHRRREAVRQRAQLAPIEQSRAEAALVREATSYKGGAQGG